MAKGKGSDQVATMTAPVAPSNNVPTTNDEVIENLKTQYQEFSKAAEEARTMALKALGALEVLTGLKEQNKEA